MPGEGTDLDIFISHIDIKVSRYQEPSPSCPLVGAGPQRVSADAGSPLAHGTIQGRFANLTTGAKGMNKLHLVLGCAAGLAGCNSAGPNQGAGDGGSDTGTGMY